MKKGFLLFLILALFFQNLSLISVFANTSPSVMVSNVSGAVGDTIEVPIILSDNTGFCSINLEIGYDSSALRLTSITYNPNVGATYGHSQYLTENPYNVSWNSLANVNFNGTLATLTFEIISSTKDVFPITVDYFKGRDGNYIDGENVNYDEAFNPINLQYKSGNVVITGSSKILVEDASTPETSALSITLDDSNISGKVIGCLYSDDGKLISSNIYPAASSFTLEFDVGTIGAYAKILWWNDDLTPRSLKKLFLIN